MGAAMGVEGVLMMDLGAAVPLDGVRLAAVGVEGSGGEAIETFFSLALVEEGVMDNVAVSGSGTWTGGFVMIESDFERFFLCRVSSVKNGDCVDVNGALLSCFTLPLSFFGFDSFSAALCADVWVESWVRTVDAEPEATGAMGAFEDV